MYLMSLITSNFQLTLLYGYILLNGNYVYKKYRTTIPT